MRSRLVLLLVAAACGPRSDLDRDGYGVLQGDCDDDDPAVHPSATELCNDADDDCDGEVDEEATGGAWFYVDGDGDGYGLLAYADQYCLASVDGWAPVHGDCDDDDPSVHPGADERCNDLDDDCDSRVDENPSDPPDWFRDAVGDGYGDPSDLWVDCDGAEGWVSDATDCDDGDPDISPGARETCFTDLDDDCDGDTNDPGADDCVDFYQDSDGDGYGGAGLCLCEAEDPWTFEQAEDCDDDDPTVHPGAEESDGMVDQDCDGMAWLPLAGADARLLGGSHDDWAGYRVVGPGDINGDGTPDLAVGAFEEDASGTNAGAAFVVFGPVTGDHSLEDADARLLGVAQGDAAGVGLAAAGDTNGDGYADLVVGAYYEDSGGTNAGAAYLVLGPISGELSLAEADGIFTGEAASDYAGFGLGGGQDVNGDGLDDVVVSAWANDEVYRDSGAVYLLHGPATSSCNLADADAVLYPPCYGDRFGYALALGGDRDGDGMAELVVGTYLADYDGTDTGAVFVYEGPVPDVGAYHDACIIGEAAGDNLGFGVSGDGDYDGDGYADLALGAYQADFIRENAGAVYVITEDPAGDCNVSEVLAARIVGSVSDAQLYQVASAGDVDADGRDDLLLGARYSDHHFEDGGMAWLLYGPVTGNIDLATAGQQVFEPEGEGDGLGCSLAGVGDVDGDGFGDVLLGALAADGIGSGSGAAYLVLGGGR
jgi:hypothetical protein